MKVYGRFSCYNMIMRDKKERQVRKVTANQKRKNIEQKNQRKLRREKMDIYNSLEETDNYKAGDKVKGVIYDIRPDMGAFVVVEEKYHGLVPKNEMYNEIKIDAKLEFRVTKVVDGRLRLSIKTTGKDQLTKDMDYLLKELKSATDGVLFITDDDSPEIIKRRLNLSKKAFKRAVGRLLTQNKIEIFEDGIRLNNE